MTITGSQLRRVYEGEFAPRTLPVPERMQKTNLFIESFRRDLGLTRDDLGRPCIKEPSHRATDFSLLELAVGFLGDNWAMELKHALNPQFSFMDAAMNPYVFEAGAPTAVVPGNIPNVSAFLGSVSGLLDARMLEGYQKPEYIASKLCATIPAKTRQTRMIATGRIGNQAKLRNPGEPHARAQFQDRRILTPETQNVALACEVTFEAVFYDQTGEVLDRANSIGVEIGLYEELEFFKLFSGTTNAYNYNGSTYNTYLTTGNWINDLVGIVEDWTDINLIFELFSRMTDQETGNRITINWDTLVVSPFKFPVAEHVRQATQIESRTKASAEIRRGTMESGLLWDTTLKSPYLDQVLTSASPNGLGLTQAAANEYVFAVNTKQDESAFIKTENWPFTIQRASPTDYQMLDNKLILAAFADKMDIFSLREPRRCLRVKPS